jgi:hypothetical protein
LDWLRQIHSGRFTFVYLSDRREPGSVGKDEWDSCGERAKCLPIGDLCDWLAEWRKAAEAPKVQEFMMDFSKHLQGGTLANNGDFFESGDAQAIIVAESTQPEFLTATAAILFHYEAVWRDLWSRFMGNLQGLVLNGLLGKDPGWKGSYGNEWDDTWYSFNLAHLSWEDAVCVTFETGREGIGNVQIWDSLSAQGESCRGEGTW